MAKARTGTRVGNYITRNVAGEAYRSYVPPALPPHPPPGHEPPLQVPGSGHEGTGQPGRNRPVAPGLWPLSLHVRPQGSTRVLTDQGTQSSLSDLLLFENHEKPGVPIADVEEVSNYVAALNHGVKRMKKNFPLSVRLIREMHGILLRGGRGSNKAPGEFRRAQNWVGGIRPGKARFVPPPPEMVNELISDLEKFAHDEDQRLPALVNAALIHVQFETIHPFLDGNGRVGRLLITVLLCAEGVLAEPILYLSLHFKEHRRLYYDLLQAVRLEGDWERWCEFFLDGVTETATRAAEDASRILDLLERDRRRIERLGKASRSALKIHHYLLKRPFLSITKTAAALDISVPSTTSTVQKLVEIGVLKEVTGKARNRVFAYDAYLRILSAGTEPLAR